MRVLPCLVAVLALLAGASPGGAEPAGDGSRLVVSTGREGGSYFFIGQRLKRELILKNEEPPVVLASEGSLDNLERLHDPNSSVNLALAQADALRSYLEQRPEFASEFLVLGDMGSECALLVSPRSGGIAKPADLKGSEAGAISVDAPGSGAAVTFETLVSLDPAFGSTQAVFVPMMEALVQLKEARGFTSLKGAMLVQRPTRASPPLRAVLDSPDAYRFVEFAEGDVPNAKLPDGSPVYSFERIRVGGKTVAKPQEIATFCTRALLLGSRDKLGAEQREGLVKLMVERREKIAGL